MDFFSSSAAFSSPTPPIPCFSHSISVKLTPYNYLLWKVQIIPYLCSQRLYKFINGSHPPPKPTLDNGSPNPEYDIWLQHDQLVMSALISSLSEPVITQVVVCTSTRTVWLSLKSTYANVSQSHLIQAQRQLASLKSSTISILSYFHRAKMLADTMATAC